MSNYMTESDQAGMEGGGEDQASLIMPFYLICDTSGSMAAYMGDLNKAVADLIANVTADPLVDGMIMLSVISFGTDAGVDIPLDYASNISAKSLTMRGGTNYGAALRKYREAVDADYQRLKAGGSRFFRPCVFFLTDGQPLDAWEQAFNEAIRYNPETKVGNKMYPTLVAYGFGQADEAVLRKLAYPNFGPDGKQGRAFIAQSTDIPALLKAITAAIGTSVVSSGQSASSGVPQTVVPQETPNAKALEPEPDIF
ncbi:MAG TPA: VWA domain-containing protein [Candidatus Nanopelagicales bacterium]|nr:VWA domain-containing protein [Candidatus Nanopelagicales bacterium]